MAEKKTPDRRTLKTRRALSDALAELLVDHELHKVTVQQIADKADVNRVTFYKHFLDVYDLYDKIESECLVDLGMLMLQLEQQDDETIFTELVGYISEHRKMFQMIFSPNATGQLRSKLGKLLEGVFVKLQSEQHDLPITDKRLPYLCGYHATGCLSVISRWVLGGFVEEDKFIIQMLTDLDGNWEVGLDL
ncbi:MAG: TetR/AcrR family transcriptional regulator [Oscillospiraceae bacterium]|nr:TetR/AcrR family transcriptional regulator [Oscillospiraceae bacterium]